MYYNASPDRVNLVDEFLKSEDIRFYEWPVSSLGLNHMKHVLSLFFTINTIRYLSQKISQDTTKM